MPRSIGEKLNNLQGHMNREETLIRTAATAVMNLELIIDTMTSSVIDLIQEAKKLGIYKQERKQRLNHLMNEMKLIANSLDRRAGEAIGMVADYNEAYSEQIMPERMKAIKETRKVLDKAGLPNTSYLALLHQARVVGIAAYTAISIWDKRITVAASPLRNPYSLDHFQPKKVMDRMQQLLVFEFSKYQGREEDSQDAQNADAEFVRKMADTDMICAIMEGRIKPSWMTEDEANNI